MVLLPAALPRAVTMVVVPDMHHQKVSLAMAVAVPPILPRLQACCHRCLQITPHNC